MSGQWHTGLDPLLQRVPPAVTVAWGQIAAATAPAWHPLEPVARHAYAHARHAARVAWHHAQPHLQPLTDAVDAQLERHLSGYHPWQIALLACILALLVSRVLAWAGSVRVAVREHGALQTVFDGLKSLPIIHGIVRDQQEKLVQKIRDGMQKTFAPGDEPLLALPSAGVSADDLRKKLSFKEQNDVRISEGSSMVSGTVYFAGDEHRQLLNEAYTLFSHTNPLHADVFPSVRRMEAEVVAMTASMLGGGANGDPNVCGAMTSGGTESILSAVKASRDYMRAKRGIRQPEMIIANSAHAAFFKAAEFFKIRLIQLRVGRDYRLSGESVRRAITRNTVLVVASAPGFPHGVMDHVADIAAVARRAGVPCHSDACLGGFVLPFARKLGYRVPPFDFAVPGVTSMSVDTHKFGMAHKGTSVVLYRSPAIRQHQYTAITEWSGGLYISPGFAGSRSGALIATAWASMVHLGEAGFLDITKRIMQAAKDFEAGVEAMPELEVVGSPEMCNIAFKSRMKAVDVYKVNDLMSRRGWHLSPLQHPPAVHMCFTAQHVEVVPDLLKDLRESVAALKADPGCAAGGNAPMYGMAATLPDRGIIAEFLTAFQDVQLTP